jgi:hypothetical protein
VNDDEDQGLYDEEYQGCSFKKGGSAIELKKHSSKMQTPSGGDNIFFMKL